MKVIVAGCRWYRDYAFLKNRLDFFLQNVKEEIEIVSGGQVSTDPETEEKYGTDYLGEQYAKEKGYALKQFPADWKTFGKPAAYFRNKEMAEYGTHCICFWDEKSKGTKMMIDLATKKNLKMRIIKISQ